MKTFSIIIPHKNRPDLLKRCLESIPKRDDIQVIVIDDGSDVNVFDSKSIYNIDGLSIEYFFLEHSFGPGKARNFGIERAKGRWVLFLDSDDAFHPCISDILEYAERSTSDIIFFKADGINLLTGMPSNRGYEYSRRVDIALNEKNFQPILMYSSPCCKVISTKLLQDGKIRFPEIRYREDVVFMAKLAVSSNHFEALNVCGYCISDSSTSISPSNDVLISEFFQDKEALAIYKIKFKLSRNDKYWFFDSWRGYWRVNKLRALFYWPLLCLELGPVFFIDSAVSVKRYLKNK